MKICIDGRFITRHVGGQERHAIETVKELDKICKKNQFELVVPKYAVIPFKLQNIEVVQVGNIKNGLLWEMTQFYKYLKRSKKYGLYLMNTWPLRRPDFPSLLDCVMFAYPNIYKTDIYSRVSCWLHQKMFISAAKRCKLAFTISEFSKQEAVKYLKMDPNKIVVGGCGWNHYINIHPDYTVFEKLKINVSQDFYLSVSSRTPQKNFKWIIGAAKNNPDTLFLVVGEEVKLGDFITKTPDNVRFLGRLTDSEVKALMEKCKVFIHPAIYEGFGITPLEAISCGAKILVSNVASLPEVYGNSADYLDPSNFEVDIDSLIHEKKSELYQTVLEKYTWHNNAEIIYSSLLQYLEEK